VRREGAERRAEEHPTLNIQRPTPKGEKTHHEAHEGHEEERDLIRKSGTAGRKDLSGARWAARSGRGFWRREEQKEEPALGAVGPPSGGWNQEAGGQDSDMSRWCLDPWKKDSVFSAPL
jgi:hypothetical protein